MSDIIGTLGAQKSPEDSRDYIYDPLPKTNFLAASINLPKSFSMIEYLPDIQNQGSQGSCVAQTGACIKEYQERKDYNYKGHMSAQFMYNNRDNYPREGWTGRGLMKFLQKSGVCYEQSFPYGDDKQSRGEEIPDKIWKEAANHKITTYARVEYINEDSEEENNIIRLKDSLVNNGPAYISFPVYSNSGKYFWKENKDSQYRGGHAVAIVGYTDDKGKSGDITYDKSGFILRNSWGDNWGDDGYVIYPYKEFSKKMHWEVWSAVDEETINPPKPPNKKRSCCDIL